MQPSDKVSTLEMRISVLRDKIAEQSSTYDKMQNKIFAIVGLLLTTAGLLTYDAFRIKTPDNPIEWIMLVAALIFLGISSLLVAYDYRAKKVWSVPIGPVEETKLDAAEDYTAALEIIHQDYRDANVERERTISKKAMFLNGSLYLFIASVILLIVLKIGG